MLIKVSEHYHGCDSLPGFLGRNQFCVECESSFDHDDYGQHPCKGKKCPACLPTRCPDYRPGEWFEYPCRCGHRFFFGEQCLTNHKTYSSTDGQKADPVKKIKSVCGSTKKFPSMQSSPPTPRDRNATRVRHGRMPLLQRVSQPLQPPVFHPESHQAGAEKEITKIQET